MQLLSGDRDGGQGKPRSYFEQDGLDTHSATALQRKGYYADARIYRERCAADRTGPIAHRRFRSSLLRLFLRLRIVPGLRLVSSRLLRSLVGTQRANSANLRVMTQLLAPR
jgi:hypothetical protein